MNIFNAEDVFCDSLNTQPEHFESFNTFLIWVNNLNYKSEIFS